MTVHKSTKNDQNNPVRDLGRHRKIDLPTNLKYLIDRIQGEFNCQGTFSDLLILGYYWGDPTFFNTFKNHGC